ncbi:Ionotropic receptor 445 [Blattella germanica]|nr:Ionotropic receptor 445 [Blattella germanica]
MSWFFVMLFHALLLLGNSKIQSSNNVSQLVKSLSKCIVQITNKYFRQEHPITVLISTRNSSAVSRNNFMNSNVDFILRSLNQGVNHSLVIVDYQNNTENNYKKSGSYILLITDHAESPVEITYNMLSKIRHQLNPSLTMLIASIVVKPTEEQLYQARMVLKLTWEAFMISDAIFMVPMTVRRTVMFGIFNWIPKKQPDPCFKTITYVDVVDCWITRIDGFHIKANLFPTKNIIDMKGCILRADVVPHNEPLATITTDEVWGIFYDELEILRDALSLQIVYQRQNESSIADIILPLVYSATQKWFYTNTYPYYMDNLKWYVPAGLPVPRWKSLTKIFNPCMWIFVVAIFILGSLTSWLLLKYSGVQSLQPVDLSLVIIKILLTYLSMGISNKYQGIMATTFFTIWLFYCLIINTAYQSALICFLVDPGEYPPIKTIKDLQESGLNLMSSISFSEHFGEDFQLINTYQRWRFDKNHPKTIWEKRDSALLTNEFLGTFYTKVSFNSERNRPRITSIDENVKSLFFSIGIFSHGHLLFERMEELKHRLFSSGIPRVWINDATESQDRVFLGARNDNQFVIIKLPHIQGAFYFWAFGIITAIVVLLIEIVFGSLQMK